MATVDTITTAQQLLEAGDIGRCELIRGVLRMMSPAGLEHGHIAAAFAESLQHFVRKHRLGRVLTCDPGFLIEQNPDTVRAPDVAFVTTQRIAGRRIRGYFPGAPDLAVEVNSPNDRPGEVLQKAGQWLSAGAQVVWVVDPERQTVTIHHAQEPLRVLSRHDTLTCPSLLPGFELPLADVFEEIEE